MIPHVVKVHGEGFRPPLFCVAPAGGVAFPLYYLGPLLGDDQPFYTLQDPSLNPEIPFYRRVEDLAGDHVVAIREIQPQGPYHLAGWSFGGIVALEVAQQLVHLGERVGMLAILDMRVNSREAPRPFAGRPGLKAIWTGLKITVSVFRHTGPYFYDGFYLMLSHWERSERGAGALGRARRRLWRRLRERFFGKAPAARLLERYPHLRELPTPKMGRGLRLVLANMMAVRRYEPRDYPGSVVLLSAEENVLSALGDIEPTMGWGSLARGGVELVQVPGNHVQFMLSPSIETVAAALRHHLGTAAPAVPS